MRRILCLLAAICLSVHGAETAPSATAVEPIVAPVVPAQPAASLPVRWQRTTISNTQAAVEVSNYRASIGRFTLLHSKALKTPIWRQVPGAEVPNSEGGVAVLDLFRSVDDMHSMVTSGAGLSGDPGADGPWQLVASSATAVTFGYANTEGLQYRLSYSMDAVRPTVHAELTITNGSSATVVLKPRLRALTGIHQDDPPNDLPFMAMVDNVGGFEGKMLADYLPAVGTFKPLVFNGVPDYVALKSRFFTAIWAPSTVTLSTAATRAPVAFAWAALGEGFASPGAATPVHHAAIHTEFQAIGGGAFNVAPGQALSVGWAITIASMAERDLELLTPVEQKLKFTDGMFRFFKSLAWLMSLPLDFFAMLVGSYGWSVVMVTLMIKALLYRFTYKQYSSMLKMQRLAPEMKFLQEQYKTDRQKLGVKMMELYKKHQVNPVAGCLPALIQIPIFMALYQAFSHSADMRGAPFLWIPDLTTADQLWYLGFHLPFINWPATINPLPIIYIAATVWMSMSQKIMPGMDPQQEQMMKTMRWLPVVFGLIFYNMPSGLVLYFTINAVLSTIEMKYVKKKLGMA